MIKVALVDDHQLFRKSLSLLLSSCEGISVVYDTSDGMAFLKYLEERSFESLVFANGLRIILK
jgi:DNA-binding NarL/FixJ family response regulator